MSDARGHFECRRCGGIFETEPPVDLGMDLPAGFNLEGARQALYGLCDRCVKAPSSRRWERTMIATAVSRN